MSESQELVVVQQTMTPEDLAVLLKRVAEAKESVLVEGINADYATIPGTNKPSLLKPGAEKLCQLFGYRVSGMDLLRTLDEGKGFGVLYKCTLTDAQGRVVGVCDGWADDNEKGRRGAPRNTIYKMAQKRAMVGATLIACNASSLFTQDVESYGGRSDPDSEPVVVDGTAEVIDNTGGMDPPRGDEVDVTAKVNVRQLGLDRFQVLVGIIGPDETKQLCKDMGLKSTDELSNDDTYQEANRLARRKMAEQRAEPEVEGEVVEEVPPQPRPDKNSTLGVADYRLLLLIKDYGETLGKDVVAEVIKSVCDTTDELEWDDKYFKVTQFLEQRKLVADLKSKDE